MKILDARDRFGNRIVLTQERWKHSMKHKVPGIGELEECLKHPVEVRKSKYDEETRLYYARFKETYLCAVVQIQDGFIMTAYTTDAIKEGEEVWKQKK